jgi:hypothetical protein
VISIELILQEPKARKVWIGSHIWRTRIILEEDQEHFVLQHELGKLMQRMMAR